MPKQRTIFLVLFSLISTVPSHADSGGVIRPESGGAFRQPQDCRNGFANCDRNGRHPADSDRHRDRKPSSASEPPPESGTARKPRQVLPAYRYNPPRQEDYQHFRISCSQGINILKEQGFTEIRVRDCEGNYYNYAGYRDEYRYAISIFAQGGRIVSVIPY